MFTRCPQCQQVHTLSAALLSHAGGSVRCGNCDQEYDALGHLFDHWPDHDTPAAAGGDRAHAPVLGKATAGDPGPAPPFPQLPDSGTGKGTGKSTSAKWWLVFAVLLIITVVNAAWTFREPLLANPVVHGWLVRAGALDPAPERPFRDPGLIHFVSRDMHQHPTRSGMLALSVIFVNRADQAQPWPGLEVTLTDAGGAALARRVFSPSDYLPPGQSDDRPLSPNVHVPILLEFADPGERAVGFELQIH